MELLDAGRVVAPAELDHPGRLARIVDDEAVGQLLAAPGVSQEIFAPPRLGPGRRAAVKTEPDGCDAQVMGGLEGMLQLASGLAAVEL